jgi:hypothetical protein
VGHGVRPLTRLEQCLADIYRGRGVVPCPPQSAEIGGRTSRDPRIDLRWGVRRGAEVPFTRIWLNADFHLLKSEREQVVADVLAGELRPDDGPYSLLVPSLVTLGLERAHVSMGGNEILVSEKDARRYVFFFTFHGILDNYSGFLYVPDGGNPREFNSDFEEAENTEFVPYDENWVWVSHR